MQKTNQARNAPLCPPPTPPQKRKLLQNWSRKSRWAVNPTPPTPHFSKCSTAFFVSLLKADVFIAATCVSGGAVNIAWLSPQTLIIMREDRSENWTFTTIQGIWKKLTHTHKGKKNRHVVSVLLLIFIFFECRTVICTGKTNAPHSNRASLAEFGSLQGSWHGSNTFPLLRDCLFCAIT